MDHHYILSSTFFALFFLYQLYCDTSLWMEFGIYQSLHFVIYDIPLTTACSSILCLDIIEKVLVPLYPLGFPVVVDGVECAGEVGCIPPSSSLYFLGNCTAVM